MKSKLKTLCRRRFLFKGGNVDSLKIIKKYLLDNATTMHAYRAFQYDFFTGRDIGDGLTWRHIYSAGIGELYKDGFPRGWYPEKFDIKAFKSTEIMLRATSGEVYPAYPCEKFTNCERVLKGVWFRIRKGVLEYGKFREFVKEQDFSVRSTAYMMDVAERFLEKTALQIPALGDFDAWSKRADVRAEVASFVGDKSWRQLRDTK